jgi:hypothetical protein
MKATDLTWGLKRSEIEAPALWGARCILQEWQGPRGEWKRLLDVLHDRQGAGGEEGPRKALCTALDGGVLEAFRDHFRLGFDGGAEEVIHEATITVSGAARETQRVLFQYRIVSGYVYVTARLT